MKGLGLGSIITPSPSGALGTTGNCEEQLSLLLLWVAVLLLPAFLAKLIGPITSQIKWVWFLPADLNRPECFNGFIV